MNAHTARKQVHTFRENTTFPSSSMSSCLVNFKGSSGSSTETLSQMVDATCIPSSRACLDGYLRPCLHFTGIADAVFVWIFWGARPGSLRLRSIYTTFTDLIQFTKKKSETISLVVCWLLWRAAGDGPLPRAIDENIAFHCNFPVGSNRFYRSNCRRLFP